MIERVTHRVWTDVYQDLRLLEVVDSRHKRLRAGANARRTKSGRSRAFPIHEDLRRVLKTIAPTEDGVIFHGPRGGRLKADTVRHILVRDVLHQLRSRFPTAAGAIGFEHGRETH